VALLSINLPPPHPPPSAPTPPPPPLLATWFRSTYPESNPDGAGPSNAQASPEHPYFESFRDGRYVIILFFTNIIPLIISYPSLISYPSPHRCRCLCFNNSLWTEMVEEFHLSSDPNASLFDIIDLDSLEISLMTEIMNRGIMECYYCPRDSHFMHRYCYEFATNSGRYNSIMDLWCTQPEVPPTQSPLFLPPPPPPPNNLFTDNIAEIMADIQPLLPPPPPPPNNLFTDNIAEIMVDIQSVL
jgi:hypothetical protein